MAEVFVSYSWDSEVHNQKVLAFTNHLRESGFVAELDRMLSQDQTATNFVKMMHKAMLDHQKVIVVLSDGYKNKAETFKGGVGEEYGILLNDIGDNSNKYILVSFEERSDAIIPLGLKGRDIVDLSKPNEEERLFRKLLGEKEFEFSEVASEKPRVTKTSIIKYEPTIAQEEICSIEFVKLNINTGGASLFGGLYRSIDFHMSFDFRNISGKVVDGFGFEFRINKYFDTKYYLKTVEGDEIVYSENFTDKVFSGQTKRTKAFDFKLSNDNVMRVLGTNIQIKIFTDSGLIRKEFTVNDTIKIQPGAQRYDELVPISRDLFLQ